LTYPARIAPAPDGEIYVTDPPMKRVVRFDAAGAVVGTYAVSQGPVGIAVHADGRVFVSREDGRIGVYSATLAALGTVNPAPLTLAGPNDLAMHSVDDELYAVDSGEHRILVFAESAPGTWTLARWWGMEGVALGLFATPQAIAIDEAADHVIVTDTDNFRVQVFDTTGILLFKFGYRTLYLPTTDVAWVARAEGVAVDECGNIYLGDALMGTVRVFSTVGGELDSMHLPALSYGTGAGQLRVPCDLAIDDGRLYIANTNNSAVEVFSVTCSVSAAAAVPEGPRDSLSKQRITHPKRPGDPRLLGAQLARVQTPDNPADIVPWINAAEYKAEFDLNRDQAVNMTDLEVAVAEFGVGTVEDFLNMHGTVAGHPGLEPPHILDLPNRCGRCHSMDGAPGGMLSAVGQENLCQSCHSAGKIAGEKWIGPGTKHNSHPWGVPADDLDQESELALHLDDGDVRCGTCHDPHNVINDANYLRMGPLYEKTPLTVPNTTTEQPMTLMNPTLCGECHTDIVEQWHVAGHSHEHADPFVHYEWMMGNNWLCTGPGTPYAYCTGEGAGTAASPSAAVCTGPGMPLACCTGPGAGTCTLSAAACSAAGTPWSCCSGAGAGNCSSRESCRQCHSGFGYTDYAEDFPDGVVQSSRHRGQWRVVDCLVCHSTHGKSQDDSLLRIYDDVLLPTGQTLTGLGPGATCASCHNGRRMPPIPNPPGVTTIHYLSGGVMLEGINGVTTFDGAPYALTNSNHSGNAAIDCTACHMAPGPTTGPGAGLVGGHTFRLKDHDTGFENVANSCATTACHPGLTTINRTANGDYDGDTLIEGIQDETQGLLNLLEDALNTAGAERLFDPVTGAAANPYWATSKCVGGARAGLPCTGASAPFNCPGGTCTASVPSAELATVEDAIWNWEYVDNSGDLGVKNTGYAIGLLQVAYKGVTNGPVPGAAYRYDPAP
jgi:predicted CXXCH cytochrome family protein